ncbi:MAG: PIN domain-containing protein [Candidatus Aenigmarchaeota archaeon]|nr:PIN domain-containing protein [Candidatus Aenigmarchaeota archaeon]
MIYADTDFFLALLKDKDWLQEKAIKIYQEHKSHITTSVTTIIELLLLAKRVSINPERLLISVFEIVPSITGIENNTALAAAHYVKENGVNVFDALHAAYCAEGEIISSDHIYDRIGIKRIVLEN